MADIRAVPESSPPPASGRCSTAGARSSSTGTPAEGARDGRRLALAPHHARLRLQHDAHLRADRRAARRRDRRGAALGYFALALLGLVIAHAANNMINDYFDLSGGVDTAEYTRALYGPAPDPLGAESPNGARGGDRRRHLADLAILAPWWRARLAGRRLRARRPFVSVFYVAPPLKLKHHGLGEPGVFVVWGRS